MLDMSFIRENPEIVKKAVRDKRLNTDIDRLLFLDKNIRELTAETDSIRAQRNALSKGGAKNTDTAASVRQMKELLAERSKEIEAARAEFDRLMLGVPSIPSSDTPIGAGEEDNVELRRWGVAPQFDFPFKDHLELAESLDLVDIPRAVKFGGSRSYFLKNEGMLLELAICRFVLDTLVSKGFAPMSVPLMVKEGAMQGTGYFPDGRAQAYGLPEDDLFLIGTSEVSLVSYHQGEVLQVSDLPLRYTGYSTCFRREAGTYGKDTRGLYRVHQFQKVEQVVFCRADAAEAEKLHNEILSNTEGILQALGMPYRVMSVCTGDMGIGKVRMHDVETWMPSRGGYCETHSCSTLGEFQARRSNIRYRDTDGKLRYVQTLNNTGIASPRILIPLLELNQRPDGSVKIPEVLVPYMNGRTEIKPKKKV